MTYDNDLEVIKWIVLGALVGFIIYYSIGALKADKSCKPVFNINYGPGKQYDGFHCR